MGRVVWMLSVSLDGFMEGPNREIDWHVVDDTLLTHFNDWLGEAGAFLDGRVTFELMAGYWPTADRDPATPPAVARFARIWREVPKYVYSRTLGLAGHHATIVREVVPGEVEALKRRYAKDLVVGGAALGNAFLRLGLIDEIRVYVHPVLVGRGKPMFEPLDGHMPLRLEENRVFDTGVVLLRYTRT